MLFCTVASVLAEQSWVNEGARHPHSVATVLGRSALGSTLLGHVVSLCWLLGCFFVTYAAFYMIGACTNVKHVTETKAPMTW